ncbi:MAG: hypothetical protein CMM58_09020 [Rhodospirillaceae bacterium]|nr:hypothetical protein [Rhodospirillaceae bacterium]
MGRLGKLFLEIFGALFCGVLILIAIVAWRLSVGPISLDFARNYLENALVSKNSSLKLNLGEPILRWEGWNHVFDITFNGVDLSLPDKSFSLRAPKLVVRLSGPALVEGILAPSHLKLESTTVKIGPTVSFDSTRKYHPLKNPSDFLENLIKSQTPEIELSYIESVEAIRSSIILAAPEAKDTVVLDDIETNIIKLNGDLHLRSSGRVVIENSASTMQLDLQFLTKTGEITGTGQLLGLPSKIVYENIANFSPKALIDALLDLNVSFKFNLTNNHKIISGSLEAKDGQIEIPELYTDPMSFTQLRAEVTFDDIESPATSAIINIRNGELSVIADLKWDSAAKKYQMELHASSKKIRILNLYKYWPKKLDHYKAPRFLEKVKSGVLYKSSMYIKALSNNSDLSDWNLEDITAQVNFQDLTVNILPTIPPITGLSGTSILKKTNLIATATEGAIDDISLKDSNIRISYDKSQPRYAEIELSAEGRVESILRKLKQDELGLIPNITSIPDNIGGYANLTVNLTIPRSGTLKPGRIRYTAVAEIKDANVPNFLFDKQLSKGKLDLTITPSKMSVSGHGFLDKQLVSFDQINFLSPNAIVRYQRALKLVVDGQELERFLDYPPLEMLGPVPTEIETTRFSNGLSEVSGLLDLQDTKLTIPHLNWRKPAGAAGRLRFLAEFDQETLTRFKRLNLVAADLSMDADAEFSLSNGQLARANIHQLKIAKSQMTGAITLNPNGRYQAQLTGPKLNVDQLLSSELASDSITAPFSLTAEFDQVFVWDLPPIKNAKLKIENLTPNYSKIQLVGIVGSEPVVINSWIEENQRHFKLTSNHAGRVLRGFDIVDSITGGWLTIEGKIIGADKDEKTLANISIIKFGLQDAPLFTQMLNAASLVGLLDTLRGKGIQFEKLNAEAIFTKKSIEIIDSFAFGASLGVSAKGTIARDSDKTSVKGMIVPAYGLNRLIDQIPVLGRILTGGEKEGLLAAQYFITGTREEPIVTVNPLTAFTPGFLRAFVKATREPIK